MARAPTTRRRPSTKVPAATLPVARVAVDVSLAHLDRPFDYLLTEEQAATAAVGVRVRLRFAGQLVHGFVVERAAETEHGGRLAFVERVVSPEPVLTPEIARLCRAVADRWAGVFADVARLAVPPRHATAEAATAQPVAAEPPPAPSPGSLDRYDGGDRLLGELAAGGAPRVVWCTLPGQWPAEIALLASATLASGRGVVVVVPDHRDVVRVDAALGSALGAGRHVALTADLGPAERYRRFLALSRGAVHCVVGTRSAVWAPVRDLGAVIVWDDGDDLLAEPRAPYCHARDVAVQRAHLAGSALVIGGHAVTAEAALLVDSGWAAPLDPRPESRIQLPAVRAAGADDDLAQDAAARAARLPTSAWRTARDGLATGRPVLVQVPRRGYQPSLACAQCRTPARCAACAGPLARAMADAAPVCRWCGVVAADRRCPVCASPDLRAVVVGARRTAEELGRAFPGVPVRTSGGDAVVGEVPARAALVVATPGAEPVADGGYAAALLLDGWALLSRPDLRAGEEALRRWLNAASLVGAGGRVVVVAPGELRPVQALLRWQPRWHAGRELEDRRALHLPPAARMAEIVGPPTAVADLVSAAPLPASTERLGPVAARGRHDDQPVERLLVRVPRRDGAALAAALKQALAGRSARKSSEPVRVAVDPLELD